MFSLTHNCHSRIQAHCFGHHKQNKVPSNFTVSPLQAKAYQEEKTSGSTHTDFRPQLSVAWRKILQCIEVFTVTGSEILSVTNCGQASFMLLQFKQASSKDEVITERLLPAIL